MNKHLVVSDIHENYQSFQALIEKANALGGFDDIWTLGDMFGHLNQKIGRCAEENDKNAIRNLFNLLERNNVKAIRGNWEFWLLHPELDETKETQRMQRNELQRIRLDIKEKWGAFEKIFGSEILTLPLDSPEFTLFHGCSFDCHSNAYYSVEPCECYLHPENLNIVIRQLFGNIEHLATPHFLFGHTHRPGFFAYSTTKFSGLWRALTDDMLHKPISYDKNQQRFGINPGSGGSCDGITPATALIVDSGNKTFTFISAEPFV